MTYNELIQDVIVSPIDGVEYSRSNGQFMRHISNIGYNNAVDFLQDHAPELIPQCKYCSSVCKMYAWLKFRQTCGAKVCISANHQRRRLDESSNTSNQRLSKFRNTMHQKTTAERSLIVQSRKVTAILNNSYKKSVSKRRSTKTLKYNNPNYNNSAKISATKYKASDIEKRNIRIKWQQATKCTQLSDFHTTETWYHRSLRLELEGKIVPKSERTDWYNYKTAVRYLTEQTYVKYQHIINPHNYTRGLAGIDGVYQLDHIMSIKQCFELKVPVSQAASVNNLQMLPWIDNIKKSSK